MIEAEGIYTGTPTGSQPEIDQLDWDYQAALSRRERSRHIAASVRTLALSLRNILARLRGHVVMVQAAPLQHQ